MLNFLMLRMKLHILTIISNGNISSILKKKCDEMLKKYLKKNGFVKILK